MISRYKFNQIQNKCTLKINRIIQIHVLISKQASNSKVFSKQTKNFRTRATWKSGQSLRLDFFQLPYKPHRPTASVCTLHTKDNYGRNSIASAGTTDARPLSTELRPIRTRRPFPRQKSQHTCLSTHRHQADPGSAYSCEVCTWHAWSGVGVPAWRSSPQKMCSWLFHV